MNSLRTLTQEYVQTDAISQSAATLGVLPSIFANQYYPQVYTAAGAVRSSVRTFPAFMGNHGEEFNHDAYRRVRLTTSASGCRC